VILTGVKKFVFDSAHRLPNYNGPCQRLHGHTYTLLVGVRGATDEETGMVVDFADIKRAVKPLLQALDHQYLNELSSLAPHGVRFPADLPTAERMVEWFARVLQTESQCWQSDVSLTFVRLYETPTSYAEWRKA